MKNNKYKKILYLLGLTSMLTLNGCSNDKTTEPAEVIETIKERMEKDEESSCLKNHLDQENLEIKTLSDGTEYITDANVFYALRERFLNNNILVNFENVELNDSIYIDLLNNSDYLYLYDNTEVRNHLTYYMMGIKNMYPGMELSEIIDTNRFYDEYDTNVGISAGYKFADNVEYSFSIDSYFANYEMIDLDISSDTIEFSKYMHCNKLGESKYNVIEQYSLSSVEKQGLNRIRIGIKLQYTLDKDLIVAGNYLCDNCDATITLNSGEDALEVELNEEQFNQLANILTEAARNDITVEHFLEENNELMTELCGEEYSLFLEKTNAISYTFKKPVQ